MAKDLNRCDFIGRLARDIELKYMQDGKEVANGTMAVNGYKEGVTEWIKWTAFGKLAAVMAQYLTKGSQLYLSGRMQTRSYEKDGQTRHVTEIIANEVQFLGGGQRSERPPDTERPPDPVGGGDNEDMIPF